MGFINKSWQRNMSSNLVSAGERVGGAVVASLLLKKFAPNKGANATATEKTLYNVGGPALLLTSVALDLVAANENIRCLAQGMAVAAATHSIAVIAPAVGESFGLSGVEVENSSALMGASGEANSALSAGDTLPEEFDGMNNFQTDGNPWAEVAEKIDDPNTTIKVEGIPAESALMGEEPEEEEIEESALMGLF